MENHIGEKFEGVISGVTQWGMFVELDNSCEGMIRAASMEDDFYVYDEASMKLVGERYHKEYTLGMKVMIRVLGADRITKTIDFMLIDPGSDEENFYPMGDRFVPKARKIAEDKARKIRKLSEAAENKDEDADCSEAELKTLEDSAKERVRKRLVEYAGKLIDLNEYEPDPRTGEPQPKHRKGSKSGRGASVKTSRSGRKKSDDKGDKKKSTRKVYKVHKYKKSATSKAARSAQGKGKRRK